MKKNPDKVNAALIRAKKLPSARRAEIASNAAAVRWGLPRATHKGSFKEDFGIDVECYVLDDPQKTAVISQRGMGETLGLPSGGAAFPRFLATQAMLAALGAELRGKLENPLKFQWASPGANRPPGTIHGFNVTLLIDLSNAIIAAESAGKLPDRYIQIAQQAHVIVGACAKSGITRLVYTLAGYNPGVEEVIAAFKLYVQEEAKKYEPEFPNELYMQWHRLYNIPVPVRGKPWLFKSLTVRHIYHPLAKSSGKVLDLLRALKAQEGDRAKKLFQFLSEIGAKALRFHMGRIVEMAETSQDKWAYEKKIAERFGGQQELDLYLPTPSAVKPDDPNPSPSTLS